ncbi:hypothetical protein Zmor_004286 [Zophobas morio]|uniref:ABC transporter domain-containing protein n=1 Tax=Zophobas morio TaxID=2755281 RepID=A0AA38LZH5_9CUCU|nr:hypothetical protein Zmor_004286 [Zophobas morio]
MLPNTLFCNRDEYDADYQSVRNKLGNFGLEGYAHEIPIKDLSGGQKARVVFAALYFMRPHVLFLDEPTNHLDIESIEALILAINEFTGGVVCITHDSRLIQEAQLEMWVVEDNNCYEYDGTYETYKSKILKCIEEYGSHHNKEN